MFIAVNAAFLSGQPIEGMSSVDLDEVTGFRLIDESNNNNKNVIVNSTDKLPVSQLIRPMPSPISLRQEFLSFKGKSNNTDEFVHEIAFVAPSSEDQLQEQGKETCLKLLIDEGGVLAMESTPSNVRLKKIGAYSERKIGEKQLLLARIAQVTENRRHGTESLLGKLVHTVAKNNRPHDDEVTLLGDDYVA